MTRSRAVERREQRETEKRAQQRRWTAIGIVAAVIILAVLVFIVRQPADAPLVEASAVRYAGLTQSRTEDGFARLGDPAASTNVTVYTSFASTNAAAFHQSIIERLVERVRSGDIQLIYVPLTLGNPDGSQIANGVGTARAALCVIEQNRFWELADTFFSWPERYGNQAFTNNRIVAGLDALGIDQGAYNGCLSSSRPADALNEAENAVQGLQNFAGMPTLTINGAVPLDDANLALTSADAIIERIDSIIAERGAESEAGDATEPAAALTATPPASTEASPTSSSTAAPSPTPAASATQPVTRTTAPEPTATSAP